MSDEYSSDFTNKLNNINTNSLQDKQKEINKLLNKKEKELNFEMQKFHNEVKENKKHIFMFAIFSIILFISILAIFLYQANKNIHHSKEARISVVQVLRKLNNKIDEIPITKIPQSKKQNLKIINQKIVSYKNKKYLKILKSDITKIKTQPNYIYLEIIK